MSKKTIFFVATVVLVLYGIPYVKGKMRRKRLNEIKNEG
jgi:hypothetical protein